MHASGFQVRSSYELCARAHTHTHSLEGTLLRRYCSASENL